jgi:hypothetical protein
VGSYSKNNGYTIILEGQNFKIETINSLVEFTNIQLKNSLFEKLVLQIAKDFSMCGYNLELEPNITPNELVNTIYETIEKSIQNKISLDIRSLLYRIDVSEKQILHTNTNSVTDIVVLILKREIQKIILKSQFSQ